MKVSVLVVSYNVRDLLARCLGSIDAGTEVVVVDNASADGSAQLVRESFPAVTLLALESNRGFSAGVNAAAAAATGDVFLLLNPDAELQRGTLARMVEHLGEAPDVVAMGFRQVDADGRFQLAVGPPPWLWADLVRKVVQRRLDAGDLWLGRTLDRLMSRARTVPWVAGSSMLVRRDAFEAIGGYDEGFFLYFEDIDFCLRLRQTAGRIVYDPSITVIHHRGRSADADRGAAERAYRHSQLRFWEKHRGAWIRRLVHVYLAATGRAPER